VRSSGSRRRLPRRLSRPFPKEVIAVPFGIVVLLTLTVAVALSLPVGMLIAAHRSSKFDDNTRALLKRSSRRLLVFQSVLAALLVAAAVLSRHGHREAVQVASIVLLCLLLPFLVIRIRSLKRRQQG
jgi:hypothetical protein